MLKTLFFLFFSLNLQAQHKDPVIGFSGGTVGGSWYDVPAGFKLNKYGKERLSPQGFYFLGTLESDAIGNLYFRKLSVSRKEDGTKLGSQNLLLYQSPKLPLKTGDNWKLSLDGHFLHYDQKDHFMYFMVNQNHVPDIEKNLQFEENARVNQRQTFVAPELTLCFAREENWKQFDFSGFAELSLAPIGFINYKSSLIENNTTTSLDQLNKAGSSLAAGGQIFVEGMVKYNDKYYLKARILQSHFQGFNGDRTFATNRISHFELGYNLNSHLSANLQVENNELILHNKERHAIDVYNLVGVGLKYKIPYRK